MSIGFVIEVFFRQHCSFLRNHLNKVQAKAHFLTNSLSRHMAASNFINQREWHPENIIKGSKLNKGYACIVINRKINIPEGIVENLWQNAGYRCTVDGGTNRWREYILTHQRAEEFKLPDFITGDFDSITRETSEYFNKPVIQRVHTPDQNYTDFTKAIFVLEPFLKSKEINDILVFHETSGRLDHIMANVQTLFRTTPTLNVYLLGGNSLTWLLRPGKHIIHIPNDLVENNRWCALLPVGGKSTVKTEGLKWDLDDGILAFGDGIVSSSNSYSSTTVNIVTDTSILWSMGVFNFHDD